MPPVDHYGTCANDMVSNLTNADFKIERGHHDGGHRRPGRDTIASTPCFTRPTTSAVQVIVKNTAWHAGKTVTFMPKPLFGDNGSGMHAHQSLWKDGQPLFHDEAGYGGLSDMARYYIGGLLHHAPSLLAFTNPTVNSYHRLVPGFEAPVNLVYSARNRSACIRIPLSGATQGQRWSSAAPIVWQPVCRFPRDDGVLDASRQDRAAGPSTRTLRAPPRRPGHPAGAGEPDAVSTVSRRPRLPARGRVFTPTSRDVDRPQAHD